MSINRCLVNFFEFEIANKINFKKVMYFILRKEKKNNYNKRTAAANTVVHLPSLSPFDD